METGHKIAVIGTGASALYLLKNLQEHIETLASTIGEIVLYERGGRAGMGMPYNPATTDRFNLCNISSEEVPYLEQSLADWLRTRPADFLDRFGMKCETISDSETYPRLAIGEYFSSQFQQVVAALRAHGMRVTIKLQTPVDDLRDDPESGLVYVITGSSETPFNRVVIATGHPFNENDEPENGYFASPWPIQKLATPAEKVWNVMVGTLGASLSAFDVVTSLAHRHGRFKQVESKLRFISRPDAPNFKVVMHTTSGWLPHLQYLQCRPFREVYRYVSREKMLSLRDRNGVLFLDDFFNSVCRKVLSDAFAHDGRADIADRLRDGAYTFEKFVDDRSAEHTYEDPFVGMKREFSEAAAKVDQGRPVRWKEALDDLMYTLSYHAELLPAEDHERLKKTILPFLNSVIAAMPLISAEILLALYDAGRIELIAGRATVKEKSGGQTSVEVEHDDGTRSTHTYGLFVDCTGQSGLDLKSFPFPSLVQAGTVRAATAIYSRPASQNGQARSQTAHGTALKLPGIDIDAIHRVIGTNGQSNPRLYDIAFPHTIGLRPYSYGLQACNHTAGLVVEAWKIEALTGSCLRGHAESLTRLHDQVANEA